MCFHKWDNGGYAILPNLINKNKNKTKFIRKNNQFSYDTSSFFNDIKKAIDIRDERVYRKLSLEFTQIWINRANKKLNMFEKI